MVSSTYHGEYAYGGAIGAAVGSQRKISCVGKYSYNLESHRTTSPIHGLPDSPEVQGYWDV